MGDFSKLGGVLNKVPLVFLLAVLVVGCAPTITPVPVPSPLAITPSSDTSESSPSASNAGPGPRGSPVASLDSETPQVSAATPAPARGVATRLVIPSLGIDLAVIAQTKQPFPCGVAEYIASLHQPGESGAVYLYGQPFAGTMLRLRQAVLAGQQLVGIQMEVYTSANAVFTYAVTSVLRHQTNINAAAAASSPELWVQTSDDSRPNSTEIQVVASQTGTSPASASEANPVARPKSCP